MSAGPPASVRTVPSAPEAPSSVVLVRHGEASCNLRGVVGGRLGCTGLSAAGIEQAGSLRRRLEATAELGSAAALYSSVLPRAVETASVIRPAVGSGSLEILEDCGLCELHPGDADGLSWSEFTESFGEPDWDRHPGTALAPGGESWSGFVARAAGALEELAGRHAGEQVVVVCHAGVVEAAMLEFLPVGGRRRLGLRTAHVSLTEFETGPWRLLRYNDAAHLMAL